MPQVFEVAYPFLTGLTLDAVALSYDRIFSTSAIDCGASVVSNAVAMSEALENRISYN